MGKYPRTAENVLINVNKGVGVGRQLSINSLEFYMFLSVT